MNPASRSLILFCLVLAALTAAYLGGVAAVPFHPDESTNLFTSGDIELFFHNPAALFWQADQEGDLRQHYRELDPPLPHSLIGLARLVTGQLPLSVDWDWGKSWQANQQAGALPSADLLLVGRLASAIWYPFTILLFFLAVRYASNDFTAWAAALLLASNALVLLHTRRAMAEGFLLFTTALCLWSLTHLEKRPWLISIPSALAFCAKQSLAALAPVGLLAAVWLPGDCPMKNSFQSWLRQVGQRALVFLALFLALVYLFNPFLWQQPVPAAQAAIRGRFNLAHAQAGDRPEQSLSSPGLKLIGFIGSVYLTPPATAETSNYLAETQAADQAYLANPLNRLFRSLTAGGLLLVLSLFGYALAIRAALCADPLPQRRLVLLLTATLAQTLALLALIPLPWQRYYLPAVPFACLWAAFGLDQIRAAFARACRQRQQKKRPAF